MPLLHTNGSHIIPCGQSIDELQSVIYPAFQESSKVLCSLPTVECSPRKGLLYVRQREYAVVTAQDGMPDTLGSDDATTCHIAVLRHSGSHVTGLGHFDGCHSSQGVRDLVECVHQLSKGTSQGRLELHLVGGFIDDCGTSDQLSKELLNEFHKLSHDVYLVTACITGLNNTVRDDVNFPVIYGVAISTTTGDLFPASFAYKGPDEPLRTLMHFIGDKDVKNIFDVSSQTLRIGPYSYSHFQDAMLWLQQSDCTIRRYMSTSPAAEPEYFAQSVRQALLYYLKNPQADVVFPNHLPHVFTMGQDGHWHMTS